MECSYAALCARHRSHRRAAAHRVRVRCHGPLTTSDAGASAWAALYALTSPVRNRGALSEPEDALYARVVRTCEPSGLTHKAAVA